MNITSKQIVRVLVFVSYLSFWSGLMLGEKLGGMEWKRTAKVFGDIGLELGEALNRKNGTEAEKTADTEK